MKACYYYASLKEVKVIDISHAMLIKRINDWLEKQVNNTLRAFDLTMSQMGALQILRRQPEGEMALKRLEHDLHVAQSTAAGIVCRLEQKGFVQSFGQADDKRVKVVRITDQGLRCCSDADGEMAGIEDELLAQLSTEEKNQLFNLLLKLLPQD